MSMCVCVCVNGGCHPSGRCAQVRLRRVSMQESESASLLALPFALYETCQNIIDVIIWIIYYLNILPGASVFGTTSKTGEPGSWSAVLGGSENETNRWDDTQARSGENENVNISFSPPAGEG